MDVFHDMLLHSNTGEMVQVEVDLAALTVRFGDKSVDASSLEDLQRVYEELMSPYLGTDSPWLDESNRPVRAVRLSEVLRRP